jgi:hypothetical protein
MPCPAVSSLIDDQIPELGSFAGGYFRSACSSTSNPCTPNAIAGCISGSRGSVHTLLYARGLQTVSLHILSLCRPSAPPNLELSLTHPGPVGSVKTPLEMSGTSVTISSFQGTSSTSTSRTLKFGIAGGRRRDDDDDDDDDDDAGRACRQRH